MHKCFLVVVIYAWREFFFFKMLVEFRVKIRIRILLNALPRDLLAVFMVVN